MQLDYTDFAIILYLLEHPLATDVEISTNLSDFAFITKNDWQAKKLNLTMSSVGRRISFLKKGGIIYGAQAQLDYDTLGLELHYFILIPHPDHHSQNIAFLEKFCDIYPYTIFRNRIYGHKNALFAIFALPHKEIVFDYLLSLFQFLITENILVEDDIPHSCVKNIGISTNGDFSKFDIELSQWSFDAAKFRDTLLHSDHPYVLPPKKPEQIKRINRFDSILLREFTKNMMRKQVELMEHVQNDDMYVPYLRKIPKTKQSYSRKINVLKERHVRYVRLLINSEKFTLFNQVLFFADINETYLANFIFAMKSNIFPFPSSLSILEGKFTFWAYVDHNSMTEIADILAGVFDNVIMYVFSRKPTAYFFYHENYEPLIHEWKVDKSWCYSHPLADFKEALEKS